MEMLDFKTWGDHLRDHCIEGRYDKVLSLFTSKVRYPFCFRPDDLVLQSALKSCANNIQGYGMGRTLHGLVVKLGYLSCIAVSKGLLNAYAKAKAFSDCRRLFDQMPKSDTVVWNIVLAGLSGSQAHDVDVMRLVYDMYACNEVKPNPVTVAIVLPVCARLGCLGVGKSIHSYAVKSGWTNHTLVGNALISMYAKCAHVHDEAYRSFCEIYEKDVVSWNAMIAGFSENGAHNDACSLFRAMLVGPIVPNYSTVASILPVFSMLDSDVGYSVGVQLHAYCFKVSDLRENTFVLNAFMSFYVRVGVPENAEAIFDAMNCRDIVSWNIVIGGCVLNNEYTRAVRLFRELVLGRILRPDPVTLITVLSAYGHLNSLGMVKQIHCYILKHINLFNSFSNTSVSNALINAYAKCRDVNAAFNTFMTIKKRDLISWNSMLDAFAANGCEFRLVDHLCRMLDEGIRPDSITMLTLIRFYAGLSRVNKVKEIHGYLLRLCLSRNITQLTLSGALLEAYAQCGSVTYAYEIYDKNMLCEISALNSMIRGFVENDRYKEAASLLTKAQAQGVKPTTATIMSIISMCTKLFSIMLLRQCHGYVVRGCIEDIQMKGTLIDAYSKCGSITTSDKLFRSSTHRDVVMYTSLIGGYATHGMGHQALHVFNHMLESGLTPDHVAFTAVLSACSHSGLVEDGLGIFHSMKYDLRLEPTMEQYCTVVDLLSRYGRVKDAYNLVKGMPVRPNSTIWSILLGACRTYGEVELGQIVSDGVLNMEDYDIGSYVTMSNLHAADAKWDDVLRVRDMITSRELKKPVGYSWSK